MASSRLKTVEDWKIGKDKYKFHSSMYESKLLLGLSDLKTEDLFTDITLLVENTKFRAHRLVLAASSRYFKAMFMGGMCEQSKDEVRILGIRAEVFSLLLQFIYTGEIELTIENCLEVLAAADMLELTDVLPGCCLFLKDHLSDDNSIGIYLFADSHSCTNLKEVAEAYILNNFLKVCKSEEFNRLPLDVLVSFLQSENLRIDEEYQVFTSAVNWIQYDLVERRKFMFDVMATIRFSQFPQKQKEQAVFDCEDISLKVALQKILQELPSKHNFFKSGHIKGKPHWMHPRKSTRKNVYLVGGYTRPRDGRWSDSKSLNTLDKFDFYRHTWKSLPSMQHARSGHGTTELDGKIYVVGGECNSLIVDSGECYDTVRCKWEPIAPMISPRSSLGLCAVDGCLYALGGSVGSEIGETIEQYDPEINRWQVIGQMVISRVSMAVVAYEGLIYVIGGMNKFGVEMKDVESYNPITREWNKLASMCTPRAYMGVAVLRGEIYVIGGRNDFDGDLNTCEKYNIEQNTWTNLPDLDQPRTGSAVCAVSGNILVAGGRTNANKFLPPQTLTSVLGYDPNQGDWNEVSHMAIGHCEAGSVSL